jgi:hypothetical protein
MRLGKFFIMRFLSFGIAGEDIICFGVLSPSGTRMLGDPIFREGSVEGIEGFGLAGLLTANGFLGL